MSEPTPRQQAGYLRRLLRRGAIAVIDPRSGHALTASVELDGEQIRLLAAPEAQAADPLQTRWAELLERLRKALPVEDAEELVRAVEAELGQTQPARSYIPQST